jgi:hypothetical protein
MGRRALRMLLKRKGEITVGEEGRGLLVRRFTVVGEQRNIPP